MPSISAKNVWNNQLTLSRNISFKFERILFSNTYLTPIFPFNLCIGIFEIITSITFESLSNSRIYMIKARAIF